MAASTTANWWQYSRWLYATGRNLRTMLLDPSNIAGNVNEATLNSYVNAIRGFNSIFFDYGTSASFDITITALTLDAADTIDIVDVASDPDAPLAQIDGSQLDNSTLDTAAYTLANLINAEAATAGAALFAIALQDGSGVCTVYSTITGVIGDTNTVTIVSAGGEITPVGAGVFSGGGTATSGTRPWLSYWYDKKNASTQALSWTLWPVANLLEFEKIIARDVKKVPITDIEVAAADALFAVTGNLRLGTGAIFGQVSGNE
jgi:hypothetical protein